MSIARPTSLYQSLWKRRTLPTRRWRRRRWRRYFYKLNGYRRCFRGCRNGYLSRKISCRWCSPYVCHKLIATKVVSVDTESFVISTRLDDFEQAKRMFDLYRSYRISGIKVLYRSDVRGAYAQFSRLDEACVRLGVIPVASANEFTSEVSADQLRLKNCYRELLVTKDFELDRRTLWVDSGQDGVPSQRNPWLSDTSKSHYGLFCKLVNLTDDFKSKTNRCGILYISVFIQFRDRKVT
ncbi:hypothetical protein D915_010758 [Fasciola hepatica]|uniref:Uncharacterized protein n=1 Tax=Fasciola hepatica TaxID=6192 RepID=A0A4E0R8L9_FASHE|nr:hypothetical protein D915_010758 [Fasciola hepatica]